VEEHNHVIGLSLLEVDNVDVLQESEGRWECESPRVEVDSGNVQEISQRDENKGEDDTMSQQDGP